LKGILGYRAVGTKGLYRRSANVLIISELFRAGNFVLKRTVERNP
jgi:hypothetical protein